MASEYLIQKAKREATPPPPPREYTRKEKLLNWLHYNKIWLGIGAVLIWIVGSMLWNILGIGRTEPDVIFAYVGSRDISDSQAEALENALASLCGDLNGDGKTAVSLRRYRMNRGIDTETAMYFNYAADTGLLADITVGESVFFLTEDPRGVQRSYQIFAGDDGMPPEDWDYEAMDKVFAWTDCPVLASLGMDEELVSGLYIGRRGFYEEKQISQHAGSEDMWKTMTMGAER